MKAIAQDVIGIAGVALITLGIAHFSRAAASIALGLFLMVASIGMGRIRG